MNLDWDYREEAQVKSLLCVSKDVQNSRSWAGSWAGQLCV